MAAVSDAPPPTPDWDDYLFIDDESPYEYDAHSEWGLATDGFPGYVPAAKDPGPYVMLFVCAYSAFLILVLPVMVVVGRQYEARKRALADQYREDDVEDGADEKALLKADEMAAPRQDPTAGATPHTTPAKSDAADDDGDDEVEGNGHRTADGPATSAGDDGNAGQRGENPQDVSGPEELDSCLSEESIEIGLDRSIMMTNSGGDVVAASPSAVPSQTVYSGVWSEFTGVTSDVRGGDGVEGEDCGDVEAPPSGSNKNGNANAAMDAATAADVPLGRPQTSTRSTVSGAPSATTSVSRLNRRFGGAFENFADMILIPQYQDDDPDYKSAISGAGRTRARTNLSAATTSRLDAAVSDLGRPRIADAAGRPGAGRRRRKHRRGIGRADMIQRAIESEERSELSSISRRYARSQSGTAAGAAASEVQSGVTNTASHLLRRTDEAKAGGGKKMSGLANEVMSGVMDDEDGRSGLAARQQKTAHNAWTVQHGPALQQQHRTTRSKLGSRMGYARSAVSGYARSAISGVMSETPTVWKNFHEDDITPNDAADANDPGQAKPYIDEEDVDVTVCCGQWALWKPKTVAYGVDKVIELAEPDKELKRIVRLGIPLTLSEIIEAFFEAVMVAIISNYLGTNAVTAYVVVELLIGLTDELVAGIIDAEGTICAHAVGAGNNFLAGQYVQIANIVYVLASIPFLCMWAFLMDQVILLFGLNAEIARIGLEYTRVIIFNYLIDGVAESYSVLLDITGHETFGLLVDIVHNVVELCTVITVVILNPTTALATVGFIHLVISVVFFVLMLGWALLKGWLSAFWGGMLGSFALKNRPAVKNVIYTAIPLSLGSFLEYGEWELLTFFAAFMGPAEVAAWALLGTVWELFEACTEGLGEAAAIRVAYHLGKGQPAMARISSYKSLLLAGGLSVFVTSGFFLCGYNLPVWFSKDKTIQHMLADLIPLVGVGNITMTFGMVCWSLVGAQGRYRIATSIVMVSSWLVTIPLGAIFVFGFNINLKGLVGSVIAGYSTSGTILSYVLLRSDWERLSKIIQELNAVTGEIDSSDSEGEDESSSSSSSSDDSSDDDSDSESEIESGVASNLSQKHLLS